MMNNRVSIIQFMPELANPAENVRRLEPLINDASNSHLVVLPELANSGYNFRNKAEALNCAEEIGKRGLFQDFLMAKAREKNIYIVSGIDEREGDMLYNSSILVGPEGLIGKYRKMHLFMNEKDIFQKGNAGLPVFDLGAFRIGMMICFDYLFPEPWRILAQKGADLVCHPSNLLTENPHRCLPGIALMNRIYVATANRTGSEDNISFNGMSFFTEPTGEIVNKLSKDRTEIATLAIDTQRARNKMITLRNHVFDDRRPEAYQP
jgi:predicted amidohydrolase